MTLAIFDLDDTLIAGDSASLWLEFLVAEGLAPSGMLDRERDMMDAYRQGKLRMEDYMRFTLQPLAGKATDEVGGWADRYVDRVIAPIIYPQARERIEEHQADGHRCVVVSATAEHIVSRIARRLGIGESLAIQLGVDDGRYTGETTGTLTYQAGKVVRLREWLDATGETLDGSHGYSDSVNDIPLLELVETAFTVNADARLAEHAGTRKWRSLHWTL